MKKTLNITKALSDSNRTRVAMALMEYDELCVCQITEMLAVATPTVSRHMSILENAELVKSRKDGRWVYYRLSEEFPPLLQCWLKESTTRAAELMLDSRTLKMILGCQPDKLCKTQKKRKTK